MSNVIEINPAKNNDKAFMMCPCTPEPTPYLAVAIVSDNPIICALVCPECETELIVVNGIVSDKQ